MDGTMESTVQNPVLSNRSSLVKFLRDEDQRRMKNNSDGTIMVDPYRSVDQLQDTFTGGPGRREQQ